MTQLVKERLNVPYPLIAIIAQESGAKEYYWRESTRSYTGFVAEVWFDKLPSEFIYTWSVTIKQSILVRNVEDLGFSISIPCIVPEGHIKLTQGIRNHNRTRVELIP
ncbi:hypothetical protein GM3708_2028 [Geminocystis sp. NIES-3708]|uniref:hypothetical protein n=1 Tax=Geminocystis sp. NIES-3708 TaxID=1615909 RepID=UPI0005FCC851|nr:hypothetical protein [Geminocystis sp. NIES-3708]BAQ61622.1 hypothetical protein GM3708_2028 [Geminocystis sp. NIES-3708]